MTKTNLAELKRMAESVDNRDFRCRPTGLMPETMRVFGFVGSHNHTPYINVKVANYIAAANPQTILALISEIEEKTKALEFYANKENWDSCDAGSVIDDEDNDHDTIIQYFVKYVGGKQARTVLTKWSRS